MRVCIFPSAAVTNQNPGRNQSGYSLSPSREDGNREVPRIETSSVHVVYEVRPTAELFAGPKATHRPLVGGVSIGISATDYGTLGGLLRETNTGRIFGLTCAHVAKEYSAVVQPAFRDGGKLPIIGTVRYANHLQPFPLGVPATAPYQVGNSNLDVALIEIAPNIASDLHVLHLGKIAGTLQAGYLTQAMATEWTGRSCGHRTSLQIGGRVKYYNLPNADGVTYCYENLFELREPSIWRNILNSPVRAGDSGAWVCTPTAIGLAWCGMIVGGDRYIAFAQEAESIENWWSGAPHGLQLQTI